MDLDYEKWVQFPTLGLTLRHFWEGTHPVNATHCRQLTYQTGEHICYDQELRKKYIWLC